jgi:ectoine hydroxylase-related dioxygenase (phytanoyl-CoA dioxygenase family)
MTTETTTITEAQKRQYHEDGYTILRNVLTQGSLQTLRDECQKFIDAMHTEMDREGTDVLGISHRNKRYFVPHAVSGSPSIRDIVFSDVMADICRATIGDESYLYWDQYVVKAAEVGMKFSWHQDSAFNSTAPHRPYVSIWCALDDMTEANGTTYILPYSRAGTRGLTEHKREEGTNDLVGYQGDDPGDIVLIPAGSVAVFSSYTLHRSGVNTTDRMRRVYLVQFSPVIIQKADGSGPAGGTEQFLHNGQRVL